MDSLSNIGADVQYLGPLFAGPTRFVGTIGTVLFFRPEADSRGATLIAQKRTFAHAETPLVANYA